MIGLYSVAPNLLLATLLGMAIGAERHLRQPTTGLTTHALVSLGAAAFSSLALLTTETADVRIGGQVVTGIGFLGAGLIMRDGLSVRGLPSAATVWATAAVGTLSGYGQPVEAIETAALLLAINIGLPRLSTLLDSFVPDEKAVSRFYVIDLKCASSDEAAVRTMLLQAIKVEGLRLRAMESHVIESSDVVEVEALVYSAREDDERVERLVGEMSASPLTFLARWTSTSPPE
ncbi:MgtC/SapB family protein [Ancylobacter sp. 6x-1]|uniref:Protein MgtC n=1 Tax=Ancylobacter crimeensis TaxID=2579147 RepID=A0ABT0D6I7_9HYPH|nr:MgtC/SapB family protein [Ancylobacter crimeensis]MCK0195452.1 MgtC/SapB family protein [Ancylobacter crimeensis]